MSERAMLDNVAYALPPEWKRTLPMVGDASNTWNPTDYMRRYTTRTRSSKRRNNTVQLARIAAANNDIVKQENLGGVPLPGLDGEPRIIKRRKIHGRGPRVKTEPSVSMKGEPRSSVKLEPRTPSQGGKRSARTPRAPSRPHFTLNP